MGEIGKVDFPTKMGPFLKLKNNFFLRDYGDDIVFTDTVSVK